MKHELKRKNYKTKDGNEVYFCANCGITTLKELVTDCVVDSFSKIRLNTINNTNPWVKGPNRLFKNYAKTKPKNSKTDQ